MKEICTDHVSIYYVFLHGIMIRQLTCVINIANWVQPIIYYQVAPSLQYGSFLLNPPGCIDD